MPKSSVPSLATIRRAKPMTQAALAKAIGVTTATVGNWESGRSTPPLKTLKAIADVLGVTVSDLLASP